MNNLIQSVLILLLLIPQTSFALDCPYNKTDMDSRGLVASLANSLKADLQELEKDRDLYLKCTGVPMNTPNGTATEIIAGLSQQMNPRVHSFDSLMLAGKNISCTSSSRDFSDLVESYYDDLNSKLGKNTADPSRFEQVMQFSGEAGEQINDVYRGCYGKRAVSDDAFQTCINQGLYSGTNYDPTNVNSLVNRVWIKNCSSEKSFADSANIQKLLNQQIVADMKFQTTNAALQFSFDEVSKFLNQISDPGTQEKLNKCGLGSRMLRLSNTLISTTLSAASMLGSPWTGLAASLVTTPITNLIGGIGSGKKKINELNAALDSLNLKQDDKFGNYVCQLTKVQELACKTRSLQREKPNACVKADKGQSFITQVSATVDSLNASTGMTQFYDSLFNKKIPFTNSDQYSMYDFLYGKQDQSLVNYLNKNAKNNFDVKDQVQNLQAIKPALDDFKDKYDSYMTSGGSSAAVKSARDKVTQALNGATVSTSSSSSSYGDSYGGNQQQGNGNYNGNSQQQGNGNYNGGNQQQGYGNYSSGGSPSTKSGAVNIDQVFTSYFDYLSVDPSLSDAEKTLYKIASIRMVDQKASIQNISSEPKQVDYDVLTDRYKNLDLIFNAFNDQSGKGYIRNEINNRQIDQRLNDIKYVKDMFSKGPVVINEEFYVRNLYPLVRDCLLGYQLNLNQSEGTTTLDNNYKKMCGFLSNCKEGNNTIGLPFELNSPDQVFSTKDGKKFQPVCQMLQNYQLISSLIRSELTNNASVCGKKITDPGFFNP